MRRHDNAGFTLIEVVMAVALLGIGLTVLLQTQAQSLSSAGRGRDMTQATLLARAKMIDIEQHLFHDGFQLNTEEEEGDFHELDHAEIKWHYRISEVEFDLSALLSFCGSAASKIGGGGAAPESSSSNSNNRDASNEVANCEAMLSTISALLGGFTDQVGRALRAVELTVRWPEGKYQQSMQVRALLSRDDFSSEAAGDAAHNAAALGLPGAGGTAPPAAAGAPH